MRALPHKGPVGRREFEIKDADPFDKDIRPRHALSAHPLRKIWGRRCAQEMPMKSAFVGNWAICQGAPDGNESAPKFPHRNGKRHTNRHTVRPLFVRGGTA
jgi:hypothetical protein